MSDYLHVSSPPLKIPFITCIKIMASNKLHHGTTAEDTPRPARSKNMSKFRLKIRLSKTNPIMSDPIRYPSVPMVKNREPFSREVWETSKMSGNVGPIIPFAHPCNRMFNEWNGYSKTHL